MPPTAVQEYRARLDARRAARDALTASDARLAHARLATFFSAVALAVLAWRSAISSWWLLAPVAVFLWLVRRHERVLRARQLAIRAIGFYERGLARLEDRWAGTGESGERFRDDRHVYANDLDLFGRGSLFELLSLARTRTGEAMLAGWLTAPADPPEIQARQAAVEELASALDLREQLALSGVDVLVSVRTDRLLGWAESPMPPRPSRSERLQHVGQEHAAADDRSFCLPRGCSTRAFNAAASADAPRPTASSSWKWLRGIGRASVRSESLPASWPSRRALS